jgi:hypothetical protein
MVLQLDENPFRILQSRYRREDYEGLAVEPPGEGFHPMANHVASTEVPLDPKNEGGWGKPSPAD